MAETATLKAERRERVGKGAARAIRRQGKLPAVIYGDNKEPLSIIIDYKETNLRIHKGGFLTNPVTIDVDGESIQALPRDYQLDPVKDTPMHIDFLRVGKNTKVNVSVPVHFENESKSPGLKKGGVLNIVRHDVELLAPASSIPDHLIADLTGLQVGDVVHISNVSLPEGVSLTITDRDFTIATIAAPSGLRSSESESETETDTDEDAEVEADADDEAEDDDSKE